MLEKNWKTLGPKLAGKIYVYMGAEDTFYLEGATRLLQKSLKDLGSDAAIEIVPGRDHGTLIDAELRQRIAMEMRGTFEKRMRAEHGASGLGPEARRPRGIVAPLSPFAPRKVQRTRGMQHLDAVAAWDAVRSFAERTTTMLCRCNAAPRLVAKPSCRGWEHATPVTSTLTDGADCVARQALPRDRS